MKVVFFGTPSFAAQILEYLVLHAPQHQIVAVVSKPDKPQGRGQKIVFTKVHESAVKCLPHVPILQPKKASDHETVQQLASFGADVFVVVAYGELVKKALLDLPSQGCLNIHASLLPHLRGAAPMQRAIMQGDEQIGVTIMRMDEGMDTGDMLLQKVVSIDEHDVLQDVYDKLLLQASMAIVEALDLIQEKRAVYVAQKHDKATLAPKILEKDQWLHPDMSVDQMYNTIRALSPKPGVYLKILLRGKPIRLKIVQTKKQMRRSLEPVLTECSEGLLLMNQTGSLLLTRVQLEGRACMNSLEFLRGHPLHTLGLVL